MRQLVIYDDTVRKSEVIEDIIGETGFADVMVKKRRLEEYYKENILKLWPNAEWKKVHSTFEYAELLRRIEQYTAGKVKIFHCFSNYLMADVGKALLSLEKGNYIEEPYRVMDGTEAAVIMFPTAASYVDFLQTIVSGKEPREAAKSIPKYFLIDGLVDIGIVENFVQCVTGNFDSRYFNTLKGNEYIILKHSSNITKIRGEYQFYHLLPDDMKMWFVMPFSYQEDQTGASYRMERLHMTDLSVKWVHGSMKEKEFEELMDKYFYFFQNRHSKSVLPQEYDRLSNSLYVDKVLDRIQKLKKRPEYISIRKMLEAAGEPNVDELVQKYFSLKKYIEGQNNYQPVSVIGHGDPCFSNALYNRSTKTLKFIDPKGALKEEDLWTNPYYDIAKLSHSICGRYDFFNYGLFDIRLNEELRYELSIPFQYEKYIEIFRRKVEENGFDFMTVRIYEVSLFLSMLPLHIDRPHKVFGFILNVRNILKEIENYV